MSARISIPIIKRANQRKQGCESLSDEFDGQFIEQRQSCRASFYALTLGIANPLPPLPTP
jgi:hypothetical protein